MMNVVEVIMKDLKKNRPNLYQKTGNWKVNKSSFEFCLSCLSNQKYYFVPTTQTMGAPEVKYWEKTYEHHYMLLDIENKKWYEWTYPQTNAVPILEKEKWRSASIYEALAQWNHFYPTLNDPNFWAKYVLKQENGKYLYLKPVFE